MSTTVNDAILTNSQLSTDCTAVTPPATDNSSQVTNTAWVALGFALSLGTTGYVKLPKWAGGLMVQWGQFGTKSSGGTLYSDAFPATFPTACLWAIMGGKSVDGNYGESLVVNHTNFTTNLLTYYYNGGTSVAPVFLAIGY